MAVVCLWVPSWCGPGRRIGRLITGDTETPVRRARLKAARLNVLAGIVGRKNIDVQDEYFVQGLICAACNNNISCSFVSLVLHCARHAH